MPEHWRDRIIIAAMVWSWCGAAGAGHPWCSILVVLFAGRQIERICDAMPRCRAWWRRRAGRAAKLDTARVITVGIALIWLVILAWPKS